MTKAKKSTVKRRVGPVLSKSYVKSQIKRVLNENCPNITRVTLNACILMRNVTDALLEEKLRKAHNVTNMHGFKKIREGTLALQ